MSIAKLFVKIFGENIFEHSPKDGLSKTETEEEPSCSANAGVDTPITIDVEDMSLSEQMVIVRKWLQDKLNLIGNDCEDFIRKQHQLMISKLGPEVVTFDLDFTSTVRISSDRLSVRSQGSFNTIKANVCVLGGRWMYEVQLHSKGVMQIGWASHKCIFNENSGVGDSKFSYGYDGSKQQVWHISTKKYGEKWSVGDVIGIAIDVDNEMIEFFRNGTPMGVAFNKLEKGPGIVFFPAISLGYNQGVQANFGNSPFKFPVEGYYPLQAKPIAQINKTKLMLSYLINMATIIARNNCCKDKKSKDGFSTRKTVNVVFCNLLIEKITQFIFDIYIIEEVLLTEISKLCVVRTDSHNEVVIVPGSPESVLGSLLSIFWNYMETDEVKFVLKKLINILLNSFTQTYRGLEDEKRRKILHIVNCLCNHMRTRKAYIEYKFFKKHCLALFLYIQPPDFSCMQDLLSDYNVWTHGIGGSKSKYMAIIEKINKSTENLYELQKSILMNLLTNTDGDSVTPSSRKLFMAKFRRYAMDVSMEQKPFQSFFLMQSNLHYPMDAPVALAFICIIIDVNRILIEKEMRAAIVEIDTKYFFDGTFEYLHYDRVGGVLSHLRKVHRSDIVQFLGTERTQALMETDRTAIRVAELDPSVFLTTTNLNNVALLGRNQAQGPPTFSQFFNPRLNPLSDVTPGNMETESSLCELLDISILFYYCVGHKYIVKIASVRDEIAALNESIRETRLYREEIEKKSHNLSYNSDAEKSDIENFIVNELKHKLEQRENVFKKRAISLARKQSWFRAIALNNQRRLLLIWLLDKTLRSLSAASKLGPLFAFVPEMYVNVLPILLDTVMDFSFHDLLVQFEITDAECVVNSAAEFLSMHSADHRIILASCKDSLLQGLGTITCHKAGIRALERMPKRCQNALIKALLRPYENRAWGQSNWLLLRFWLGDGFAYRDSRQPSVWQGGKDPITLGLCRSRAKNETHTGLLHHVAPPYPSKIFQKLIGGKLIEDEPFATAFLNSVLSQLNWAFSEFILLLQEIQNTAHRQENAVFEPKQLKICSMCFELTVSLMRSLEMVVTVAPDIFQDASRQNSDLILTRVCQLISQVLSRVTVPPGCFQFVVDMCSADLNSVTHFPIITAAVGILLALFRFEMDSDKRPPKVTRVTRSLLTDPSFQFANLEFALGDIKTPILQLTEIPRGNFDPQTRAHIDPLTNDVRVPVPASSSKRIRSDPPIIKFSLSDFPTHVTAKETDLVRQLIEMLRFKQTLLSDITLPSEDSLCPICCAKPIAVIFTPCKHQSCSNCILQHLMNSKVCFYCKTMIKTIETPDGTVIYRNNDYVPTPTIYEQY